MHKFIIIIIIITIIILLQLSFHPVAVVLTLVQTKQIRINIHKRNNTKHIICKYTYYQNTHSIVKTPPHTLTHTLQNSSNNHSTRYTPNAVVTIQSRRRQRWQYGIY